MDVNFIAVYQNTTSMAALDKFLDGRVYHKLFLGKDKNGAPLFKLRGISPDGTEYGAGLVLLPDLSDAPAFTQTIERILRECMSREENGQYMDPKRAVESQSESILVQVKLYEKDIDSFMRHVCAWQGKTLTEPKLFLPEIESETGE